MSVTTYERYGCLMNVSECKAASLTVSKLDILHAEYPLSPSDVNTHLCATSCPCDELRCSPHRLDQVMPPLAGHLLNRTFTLYAKQ